MPATWRHLPHVLALQLLRKCHRLHDVQHEHQRGWAGVVALTLRALGV